MSRRSTSLRIPADHPALRGHFPDHPILPGVVLLDEILYAIESSHPQAATLGAEGARTGATSAGATSAAADAVGASPTAPIRPGGWRISAVKFHRVALPDQALQLQLDSDPSGSTRFELRAAESLIATGTVEPHTLEPHTLEPCTLEPDTAAAGRALRP